MGFNNCDEMGNCFINQIKANLMHFISTFLARLAIGEFKNTTLISSTDNLYIYPPPRLMLTWFNIFLIYSLEQTRQTHAEIMSGANLPGQQTKNYFKTMTIMQSNMIRFP